MNETIERLAALVGFPIPASLPALLGSYPASLTTLCEREGFEPYERPLYPDLETMLVANEEVRAEDIWTKEGPWPEGSLDIGVEISGDRFALRLSESPARVYRLEHSVGRFVLIARTLEEFVAALERVARGEARSFMNALPPLADA